jgi:hypothetical protein
MKRTLLGLLGGCMIIAGCTDNATNEVAKDNPNKKISADFLEQQSFINIQHIDNTKVQSKTVSLAFNKNDLNSMQQNTMIAITPEIITGADKIKISPTMLNVSVKDLIDGKSDFQLTTTGVVNGGAVDIKFVVNQISQTNHLKFMLSHREIVSLTPDSKLYKIGTPGKVRLTVKSNVSNDNFTVSFTGRNIDKKSLTPSCSLNDFSKGFATCDDISFTATDTNAEITATIEDELREPYSQTLNVCPDGSDTLYFESIKPANIGFKQDLTLNVTRCSNDLSPLSATINFSLNSSLRLVHNKTLKDPIPINAIIGVQNSEDDSFKFKLNEITTTVVISRKPNTVTIDNFRYDLPAQLIIQANALNYGSTQKIEVNNVDTDSPKITLWGDMELEQGSIKTVQFTRDNIETTKINFCLAKTETSNLCDVDQSNYSLTEITPENLQLDLTGKKLASGQYYILARLDNDAKIPVAIAGHSRAVHITAVEKLNFDMLPAVKHVLIPFPSYYYLGISDNDTPSTVTGDKLYLYSLDSNPSYCSSITAKPIDNNNPQTEIAACTISSQTVDGSCFCPLSNGKLNKICVFKLTMPNNFVAGESCKFSVRTDKNFNEGSTLATGTNGHPEIKIQTNSNMFTSANLIDMFSDGNGNKLNDDNWLSTISSANITNNSIFDDALLFEINPSYFGTENNNFVIRNYPGKNAIDHKISLPQTAFILGYGGIWNPNRCSGYDEDFPSALGCSSGGWSSYWGEVAVPSGAIIIENNEIISASGTIIVSSNAWQNGGGANMPKLTDHSISKVNNNTIQMNLPVQNAI